MQSFEKHWHHRMFKFRCRPDESRGPISTGLWNMDPDFRRVTLEGGRTLPVRKVQALINHPWQGYGNQGEPNTPVTSRERADA
jgi:hypothetical protein